VRFVAAIIAVAALALCGCGGSSTKTVTRNLHRGEHVTLRCGLSLTVPARYRGWFAENASGANGSLDLVASEYPAQKGLMYSFSLRSATPAGEKSGPGPYRFPLIAASADGTVQVRRDGYRLHTAKAEVWVFVVLRLPGRPTGLASMMVFGKQASAAPSKVMAELDSMWSLFAVQGASLPTLAK